MSDRRRPHHKRLVAALDAEGMRHCLLKLLIECWNADAPHFGGTGPYRYDGRARLCAYCDRPKGWKPVNPGITASDLLYGRTSPR